MRRSFLLMMLLIAYAGMGLERAAARGQAEHVVVVVWDGMRPDFITPQYTPNLYELAGKGTFFKNHHSVYVTSTEVNGTALATGMYPGHSGIMANAQYEPSLGWLSSYNTESLDAVRRGDLLSGGHYLEASTVAEIVQQAGFPTIIAGAKPIALIQDRAYKKTTQAQKESVTLFRGQTVPRAALESLVRAKDIGPFPSTGGTAEMDAPKASRKRSAAAASTNAESSTASISETETAIARDLWTTKALVRGLWKTGVPKYSLLWLGQPDASQHEAGVGSEPAVAALESSDKNLETVLKALEEKGVLESTDILVVSDHGFSTIDRVPDIIESLKNAGFNAGKQFQNPETGDILVVNLGGSLSFYVFERDPSVTRRLVTYLQGTDFAGVIFCHAALEGTFPLEQAHIDTTNAPDVVVSMRWSAEKNEYGAPGLLASVEGKRGSGTHASLSRFDLHNTLVASGPDFKKGYVNETPSGNIDIAPTVLAILGIEPPQPMDGRVLSEALNGEMNATPKVTQKTIEASRELGFLIWRQHLTFTQVGSTMYYEEGNGGCERK